MGQQSCDTGAETRLTLTRQRLCEFFGGRGVCTDIVLFSFNSLLHLTEHKGIPNPKQFLHFLPNYKYLYTQE